MIHVFVVTVVERFADKKGKLHINVEIGDLDAAHIEECILNDPNSDWPLCHVESGRMFRVEVEQNGKVTATVTNSNPNYRSNQRVSELLQNVTSDLLRARETKHGT